MSKESTLEDYKTYTRKLKAKVKWLQQKNEELIIDITELKKQKQIRDKGELINFSVGFNRTIIKLQVIHQHTLKFIAYK